MSEGGNFIVGFIFGGLVFFIVGFLAGGNHAEQYYREQAVKAKVGAFVVDGKGNVGFQWVHPDTSEPIKVSKEKSE